MQYLCQYIDIFSVYSIVYISIQTQMARNLISIELNMKYNKPIPKINSNFVLFRMIFRKLKTFLRFSLEFYGFFGNFAYVLTITFSLFVLVFVFR